MQEDAAVCHDWGALCHLHLSLFLLEDWAQPIQLVCGHLTANLSVIQNLLQGWLTNSCYFLFPGVIPPFSLAFMWEGGVCICASTLFLLTPLSPFLFK